MEQQPGAKKTWSKKRKIITAVLLVLLIALLIVAGRLIYVMFVNPMGAFGQAMVTPAPAPTATPLPTAVITPAATPVPTPQASNTPKPTPTLLTTPTPEATPTPTPEPLNPESMANRINVLLVGYDSSPERLVEESEVFRDETNDFRSDVLMLVSIDFYNKTADIISVPRDSYAPIIKANGELFAKTGGKYKINAAFAKGGANTKNGYRYAMNTVSRLLGIPIEYYAGVDMTGLKAVVDAMGGVDYDVDVEIRLNGRVLRTGYQHLNGQQVLDYCRARKGISTDAGRNDRQQRILMAIFEQMQSREQLANFGKLYRSMKPHISTNLNTEQILTMAAFGAALPMKNIARYTVPGEYHSDTPYSSASYYVIDNDALVEMIRGIFGITIATNPRYGLDYVLADIAAAKGKDVLKSVDYVLNLKKITAAFPINPETQEYEAPSFDLLLLLERQAALKQLCYRAENADVNVKLDQAGIEQARAALTKTLTYFCLQMGITQRDVRESRLPEGVYDLLPEREPTPAPTSTPE